MVSSLLLTACGIDGGLITGGSGSSDQPVMPSVPPSTQDGLSENGLSQNRLSLNRLSLNRLSEDRLTMSASGLEDTPEGRELLKYVVTCALPANEELTVESGGVAYTFPGNLGFAPQWMDGACDQTCRRWISACLLAHVNALGISVPISVRGPNDAIVTSEFEYENYYVQEGAFFGDVFAEDGAPQMYSCVGKATITTDLRNDPSSWLSKRVCSSFNAALCGMSAAGPCLDFEYPYKACQHLEGGGKEGMFTTCHAPDGTEFQEVVTIYLPR